MAIGGSVGVVMVSLRLLMNTVQWGMLQATQTENYMTSTERVLEYGALEVEGLEQDPETPNGYQQRQEKVLRGGEIEFKDISLSYCGSGEKKRVLKDVNLKIRSGERVKKIGGEMHLNSLHKVVFYSNFPILDWHCWQDRSWKVLSCVRPAEAGGANQGNCYGRRPGSVQDGSLGGPPLCRPGPAAGRAHGWHTEVQLGPRGTDLG